MGTATIAARRKIAEEQALALLNLSPGDIVYARELRDLFHETNDEKEKREIFLAFVELIMPNGITKVGNLEKGVTDEVKQRVASYHRSVGAEIKSRREKKSMTQNQLAKLAGIPQSHVSRLESGKHTPTHLTIKKIAKALGTRPRMLDPGFDS